VLRNIVVAPDRATGAARCRPAIAESYKIFAMGLVHRIVGDAKTASGIR